MLKPGGKYILYFFLIFLFFSCNRKSEPLYEFVDQNLQGEILSTDWEFSDGVARMSPLKSDTIIVGLYSDQLDSDCSYARSEVGLTFFVPYAVGLYVLTGEWNAPQSVNFYNGIKSQGAWRGAIEVLSIDTVSNQIVGKVDATIDDESTVNGNFVVSLCK